MSRSQFSHLYANRRWRAKRARHLAADPLCAYCRRQGKVVVADVVDHIEPHRGDMDKFWNGEIQGLCHNCHSSVKQREEGGKGPIGSDLLGNPLDPAHPWYAERRDG